MDKKQTAKITVRIPRKLQTAFQNLAVRDGRSQQYHYERALADYAKKRGAVR